MALTAANIRVGAGRLYMGTTPPAQGVALTITNGVPATGTEVGLTEGEAIFTYEVTYFEVMAEQSLGIVGVFATEEAAQLEFTMKEYSQANINDFLIAMVQTANVAAPGDAITMDIHEGGRILGIAAGAGEIILQATLLIAPIPATSGVDQRYTYVLLHQAYQSEAAAARYTKAGDTLLKVTFKAVCDLTRGDFGTMFQIGVELN